MNNCNLTDTDLAFLIFIALSGTVVIMSLKIYNYIKIWHPEWFKKATTGKPSIQYRCRKCKKTFYMRELITVVMAGKLLKKCPACNSVVKKIK